MYEYKRELLRGYSSFETEKETIALPMGLNMFELLPFWHTFFKSLGFGVHVSPKSTKKLYAMGQSTIPSDTVCYPAKLVHGHIQWLMNKGEKYIFYPCMTYNIDEHISDNHFNCPVVAYYPEVINANQTKHEDVVLIKNYIGIHKARFFPKKMYEILRAYFPTLTLKEVKKASREAYAEYENYLKRIKVKAEEYLALAKEENLPVVVLCGRPYHLDSEVNHGIDKLITESGAVVVSEDSLDYQNHKVRVNVLNQWTYHARLYSACDYVAKSDSSVNLVQMVSFGCGLDAITTDEMRRILEDSNKIYTQIKIDEITNLGAVKIRLRSMFIANEQKGM